MDNELSLSMPGMVTFTRVKLSDDLRHAKVYYSYLGSAGERNGVQEFFDREKGRIRSLVGKGLHIRHIPEMEFTFDPSVEEGMRIEELLNQVRKDDEQ
jgi:ribosome-binding factor A